MRLPTTDDMPGGKNIDAHESQNMLRYAIDQGLNYVDTAYNYHDGKSEEFVGNALRDGYRERVYLATKAPVYHFTAEGDFERTLNEQLARLQTDHIDFYLLHTLNLKFWNEVVLAFGLLERLKQAKRDGKIRFIGFSFHDELDVFHTIVDGFDSWDFCQIQLNYINTDYQAGLAGLQYAAERGLDVMIMEPMLGGKLSVPPEQVAKVLDKSKTPVEWALDYLWNLPQTGTVLSGMSTMEQVKDNLSYADRASVGMLSEGDLEMLAGAKTVFDTMARVPCTKCAYCMPCPAGLDIPKIYEAYNLTASSSQENALACYNEVTVKADACVQCGACERACPQAIMSTELMPRIAGLFAQMQEKKA